MKTEAPSFEQILTAREKSELQGEIFRNIEMVRVDLAGADLRGAHFVLCDLRYVVLEGAKLGDNRFYGTALVEVDGLFEDDRRLVEREGGAFQHPHASLR